MAVDKRTQIQLSIRQICEHNRLNRDAYYKIKTRNSKRLAMIRIIVFTSITT
jgi:hypothetical protein